MYLKDIIRVVYLKDIIRGEIIMNIEAFKNMSDSLRMYHRITNDKYTDLNENIKDKNILEKMYVDILPNNGVLEKILERGTTFLVGQRGTGKSTIIAMAQDKIAKEKKDLNIYINAKTIYKTSQLNTPVYGDVGDTVFTRDEIFKLMFLKNSIQELCKSMIEELKAEKSSFLESVFKNNNRNHQVEELIQEIQELLESEDFQVIDKVISKNENLENKDVIVGELKGSLTDFGAVLNGTKENGRSVSSNYTVARYFNFSKIINKFLEVLDICKRKGIYIFIDDYSELNVDERTIFMNELIAPLYHVGVDKIFLKIACYPNRLSPINLDTQKYTVMSIDFYEVYGIDKNITSTEKEAQDFVKRLLENACSIFADCKPEEYFDLSNNTMEDYYDVLYKICMNIPRVLGHILNTCFIKRINCNKLINMTTLNEASLKYYHEHVEQEMNNKLNSSDVDKEMKVNIFVQQKLIQEILVLAKRNKTELTQSNNGYFNNYSEVPTSHFRTNVANDIYFEELAFYGFVHKINEIADKGKKIDGKNINTSLYAIDYGACIDEKIGYGRPDDVDTKYYQQRAFLYDECIIKVLKENKKIVCNNPNCKAEYPIEKLELFREFGMRCQKCTPGICEVKFDENLIGIAQKTYENAIWTQQEMDIIYAIYNMEDEVDMTFYANQISGEIDLSSYIIAARCRELISSSYIYREENVTPYKYGLTVRSREYIKSLSNA